MQTLTEFTEKSSLCHFHLSTCSTSKKMDNLRHLIQSKNTDFDIIAVYESRKTKNKLPPIDISILNYSYKFYPMEANSANTLIYVRNHLLYKTRNERSIKPKDLLN